MTWKDELANPRIDRDQFFGIYGKAASEKFAPYKTSFEAPDTLKIHVEGKGALAVHLDNIWREWSRTGRAPETVDHHLGSIAALLAPKQAPFSPDSVVPLVRDESYVRSMKPQPEVLCDHLVADIWIVYAVDQPGAMFPLTVADLPKLGVNRSDLRQLAMKNLPKVISRIEKRSSGSWHVLSAGNCYEASLLLIDGLWDQLQEHVNGDIVAVVPSRTIVLFTGSDSKEGIEALRQRAKEVCATRDHLVSQTLLRRSSGQWRVF